jgi:hypothetical protein
MSNKVQRLTTISSKYTKKVWYIHYLQDMVFELNLEFIFSESIGYEKHQRVLNKVKFVYIWNLKTTRM